MCCLFGLFDYAHVINGCQKSRMLSVLAQACEVRGTDATGIAYNAGGALHIFKRPVPAHRLRFHIPGSVSVVMGHARMATQGSAKKNYNNHPFYGKAGNTEFAFAHNGVIYNDIDLLRKQKLPRTKIQTDSYIAVQLIEQQKALDLDTLRTMAEQIEGSISFTALDGDDHLYFVKGDNPLYILHYPAAGFLLYASTREILEHALSRMRLPEERPEQIPLECGEIARIDLRGEVLRTRFCTDHLRSNLFAPGGISCSWRGWNRHFSPARMTWEELYLEDLKSVAGSLGYSPEDIDQLTEMGLTAEEIESYLYDGEL